MYSFIIIFIFVSPNPSNLMWMKKRGYLLIILLFLHYFSGYASMEKDFQVLTMQNGLADNTIHAIHKDKDGFMWFATNNGLSRYDGTRIRNFKLPSDQQRIRRVLETADGMLWVQADAGLYGFDRAQECFIQSINAANREPINVFRILSQNDSLLWSISDNNLQLWKYHYVRNNDNRIVEIALTLQQTFSHLFPVNSPIAAFCHSKDGKSLWLTTHYGRLVQFDIATGHYKTLLKDPISGSATSVREICEDHGCLWISTIAQGLLRYQPVSKRLDQFTYSERGSSTNLSHSDVYSFISLDSHRNLAATWNGYTVLDFEKNESPYFTTTIYSNTFSQLYRNIETRMIAAYYDPQGILWIGTEGGGVVISDFRKQFYHHYHQNRHNEICGMTTDKDGFIWLATFHKGIMRSEEPIDSLRKPMKFSVVSDPVIEAKKTVLAVVKDRNGYLWFGNADGTLTYYDPFSKRFQVYPLLSINGQRINGEVWGVFVDSRERFWVVGSNGVLLFDRETKQCKMVSTRLPGEKHEPYVRTITESKDGSIWIGTSVGVRRLVDFNGTKRGIVIGNYESQCKQEVRSVRSLLASTDGKIYVGYTDGLGVISPITNKMTSFFTTENGLCSNFIACIAEDAHGRIWLGTNSGISRYSRHQNLFYSYYISGSNRSVLFYNRKLFWGNNKSLTYFNPDDIRTNYALAGKPLFTDIEVNNRPVQIGEEINGQVILHTGISYVDRLELCYANRDFALSFSDLPYLEKSHKYAYRLSPYQKKWIITDDGNKIAYTNIPPGNYQFEVKSLIPDDSELQWRSKITTLPITIRPHWSQTISFKLMMGVLLLLVLYYFVRRFKRKQRQLEHEMQIESQLLITKQEREQEKQIRLERERFFTTAAHELRTPLTLILSPLQELLYRVSKTDRSYERLTTIYNNACSLHTLVDHLLYVQKIEAGMVKLQLTQIDLTTLVQQVAFSFEAIATTKEICFKVVLPAQPINVWIDRSKIISAINNLLSNALKYTSNGGAIEINLFEKEMDGKRTAVLSISDTGVGIPADLQQHIFDSFVTGESTPTMSTKVGIGLYIVKHTIDLHHGMVKVDSEPGRGSIFTLYIPTGKEHFIEDIYETVLSDSIEIEPFKLPIKCVPYEESRSMQRKHTLLIIEDNSEIRAYICSLFRTKYTLLEATNGEEGLTLAIEKVPDLILSDVMMPVMDGFECCKQIRLHRNTAQIPIVMLTAKAEDADVLQGSKLGADDYIMKPFNPEILKIRVENLINQREQLKQIYTKSLMLKQEKYSESNCDALDENEFITQVIQLIEANLSNEAFSVTLLADLMNLSQTTLYRKVKQHTTLSVIEIIRSIRMTKAASLVIEKKYTIQEIAEMVGFNDLTTFRQHFIKQFGVPPSKYGG